MSAFLSVAPSFSLPLLPILLPILLFFFSSSQSSSPSPFSHLLVSPPPPPFQKEERRRRQRKRKEEEEREGTREGSLSRTLRRRKKKKRRKRKTASLPSSFSLSSRIEKRCGRDDNANEGEESGVRKVWAISHSKNLFQPSVYSLGVYA